MLNIIWVLKFSNFIIVFTSIGVLFEAKGKLNDSECMFFSRNIEFL
jgi:hypothetical protein